MAGRSPRARRSGKAVISFASVEAITIRDDAGPALREAASRELRGMVERNMGAGRRVLIVPHLLSYGGIEAGLRRRLEASSIESWPEGCSRSANRPVSGDSGQPSAH